MAAFVPAPCPEFGSTEHWESYLADEVHRVRAHFSIDMVNSNCSPIAQYIGNMRRKLNAGGLDPVTAAQLLFNHLLKPLCAKYHAIDRFQVLYYEAQDSLLLAYENELNKDVTAGRLLLIGGYVAARFNSQYKIVRTVLAAMAKVALISVKGRPTTVYDPERLTAYLEVLTLLCRAPHVRTQQLVLLAVAEIQASLLKFVDVDSMYKNLCARYFQPLSSREEHLDFITNCHDQILRAATSSDNTRLVAWVCANIDKCPDNDEAVAAMAAAYNMANNFSNLVLDAASAVLQRNIAPVLFTLWPVVRHGQLTPTFISFLLGYMSIMFCSNKYRVQLEQVLVEFILHVGKAQINIAEPDFLGRVREWVTGSTTVYGRRLQQLLA